MKAIAVAFACMILVGAPAYEHLKLKDGAPAIVKELFARSEAKKESTRLEGYSALEELEAKKEGIKKGEIKPGHNSEKRVGKKWFYVFSDRSAKANHLQIVEGNIRNWQIAMDRACNPGYLDVETFLPGTIKPNAIGRIQFEVEIHRAFKDKTLVSLFATDRESVRAMIYGLSATVADGDSQKVTGLYHVDGTEDYAGSRVYRMIPISIDEWIEN